MDALPDSFVVRGGARLSGTVRIGGAKNSALKLVAAALLAEGRSVLTNVPDIADMRAMADVLVHLGARVQRDGDTFAIDVPAEIGASTPAHLVKQLRASIVVLGPLLARCGYAHVAQPGGCNLGNRNIDLHLAGLAKLGAQITYGPEHVEAVASKLTGADIELPYASVGATENLLMAAVLAQGTTRIGNAAREPEIADLVQFLRAMGADITGEGTSELVIRGVDRLHPAEHRVVGDRIEAGTFVVAGALAGDEVRVEGVDPEHLRLPLMKWAAAGVDLTPEDRAIVVRGGAPLRAVDVATLPYPGYPTDLQPQLLLLLSQAAGTSLVTENVFDGRFSILTQLGALGADIALEGHHAIVRGPRALRGATVTATDLRAGASLVLAGLIADGETVVLEPRHVDRSYADLAGRLRALGADVQRRAVEVGARV
jgi:UDP-N-acetylglucosamine 1-carboxyvinyltransferase